MAFPKNVTVFNHPLINHKIAILRNKSTGMKEFRELVEEITTLMAFESLKDIPTTEIDVETPLETCRQTVVQEKSVVVVPVLRAGLGMVDGLLELMPTAHVGHIGLQRDEETHLPVEYYYKMPEGSEDSIIIVVDPMLATGGSASDAIDFLKDRGFWNIRLMNLIAAPEGIALVQERHPDVDIYVAAIDDHLNKDAYIVPGLGDAGDRIFGTK